MMPLDPEARRRAGDQCKKCQEEILWATTAPRDGREGKPVPVNPELVYGGNITLEVDEVGMLKARVVRPVDTVEAYVAHFVTCPAAEYFRKDEREVQGLDHDEQAAAKRKALQVRFPFGKFSGQTLEEIDRTKDGHRYLQWALKGITWQRSDVRDAIAVVVGVES
jgi:hypothetical protein